MVWTGRRALEGEASAEPLTGLRNLWLGRSLALQGKVARAFDIARHIFSHPERSAKLASSQ